jgi:hypothetical protein
MPIKVVAASGNHPTNRMAWPNRPCLPVETSALSKSPSTDYDPSRMKSSA